MFGKMSGFCRRCIRCYSNDAAEKGETYGQNRTVQHSGHHQGQL